MKLRTQRLLVKRPGHNRLPFWFIGLNNMIYVDVSPVATRLIYDLHLCVLTGKSAHVPTGGHQTVASPARRTFYNFAINEQVYTGVALVIAAAIAVVLASIAGVRFWLLAIAL